jgi:hypothetical protein
MENKNEYDFFEWFSNWILLWFLLYILGIVNINPSFGILVGIFVCTILVVICYKNISYKHINHLWIFGYTKIIPLFILYMKNDVKITKESIFFI